MTAPAAVAGQLRENQLAGSSGGDREGEFASDAGIDGFQGVVTSQILIKVIECTYAVVEVGGECPAQCSAGEPLMTVKSSGPENEVSTF